MVDIALAAGVSQATVSLVLSGAATSRISAETRDKVRAVAAEMGYVRRGGIARGTGIVGLLIDEVMSTPFAMPFLDGARDEAAAMGWLVATFVTGGDAATELAALQSLAALDLKGVLYTRLITKTVHPPEALYDLPAVLVNCHEPSRRLPCVVPGDVAGMQAATEALIAAGHRRIAVISGAFTASDRARQRFAGYQDAMRAHGLRPAAPVCLPSHTASNAEQIRALVRANDAPTAFFCTNDLLAIGVISDLRRLGLSVPRDISVLGYDGIALGSVVEPPLATVVQPNSEIGASAVGRLLAWLHDGGRASAAPPRVTLLPHALRVNGTVAAPPSM